MRSTEHENLAEYEGVVDIDERLVTDLIDAAKVVWAALSTGAPHQEP